MARTADPTTSELLVVGSGPAGYTAAVAITAAGSGCAAAIDAERWLAECLR